MNQTAAPKMDFPSLEKDCDQWIKVGKAHLVAAALGKINTAQVPDQHRMTLAQLCVRGGLTQLGLKILTPFVRSEKGFIRHGSELALFGLLILRNGSPKEASRILSQVNATEAKDVHLYRALSKFTEWKYGRAIPDLEQFLGADISPYQKLVGNINLVSALIFEERWDEAQNLLEALLHEINRETQSRIYGNCNELLAQVFLFKSKPDLTRAEDCLNQAASIFADDSTFDALFVKKWKSFLIASHSKDTQPLVDFRQSAIARKHWESVREADRFILRIHFTDAELKYLLFGTPFETYRNKVLKELSQSPPTDSRFHFSGKQAEGELLTFDVISAEWKGSCAVKPGTKIHQLLDVLSRDFYRPQRIGGIFTALFPEEYFDIFHSEHRVHQILHRFRNWASEIELPVHLEHQAGTFQLLPKKGLSLLVPYEREDLEVMSSQWYSLRKKLGSLNPPNEFTAVEAQDISGLSTTSLHRLIKWAEAAGHLERHGAGKSTKYYITSDKLLEISK